MSRRLLFRLLASAPPVTDHVPDGELLRRFVSSNDSAAFELIVRRHADAVWTACRRLLRTEADAEDAFQAAFLALLRRARTIRNPCVGGWLYRVAVNAALLLRRQAARSVPVSPTQLGAVLAPRDEPPDAALAIAIHEELARLSERERLPVVLCDLEGRSHEDAAKALGWPVGTVSGRLSRARAKLRARLERRGFKPTAVLPALVAPAQVIPNALSLAAGSVSPAVVALTEGALAMTSTTWKWVAVAVVCSGALGAGAVLAFGPGVKPLPQNVAPATVPVAAEDPTPPAKDKSAEDPTPPAKDKSAEEWIPKASLDGKLLKSDGPGVPSAFPELVVPELDPNDPDRIEKRNAAFAKLCPRLTGKTAIKIDPTDDTHRKLLKARLHQGVVHMMRVQEVKRIGSWNSIFFAETYDCLADMETTVLELWGAQPKELIPWLEELVVVAKDCERFHYRRVINGNDPPHLLNAATRHRLRAEAALWKAKKRA